MAVLLEAEECLGHGVGLGGTLQRPQQDGSCQHRMSSRGMLWRRAQVLDSEEDTAAHPASPVWASRWAWPAYPWQGSRMLGMRDCSVSG